MTENTCTDCGKHLSDGVSPRERTTDLAVDEHGQIWGEVVPVCFQCWRDYYYPREDAA